jgi:hypothetical protein
VKLNDSEPLGDGDQSLLPAGKLATQQFYRNLYANGDDISYELQLGMPTISEFVKYCVTGNVIKVRECLKVAADKDPIYSSESLTALLETRETSQRLSPLLLMVSMTKIVDCVGQCRRFVSATARRCETIAGTWSPTGCTRCLWQISVSLRYDHVCDGYDVEGCCFLH